MRHAGEQTARVVLLLSPESDPKTGLIEVEMPQGKPRFRCHMGSCPWVWSSCNKAGKKTLLEDSRKIQRRKRFRAKVHHASAFDPGGLHMRRRPDAGRNSALTIDVGCRGRQSDVAVGAFEVHARQRGCSHRALGMLSNRFGPATLFT
jgi:hypothetical protein